MNVAEIDAAFDRAEREIRDMGQAVVDRIAIEFRARRIDQRGVQERVSLALAQLRALPAETIPTSMCRQLEQILRQTIVEGLQAAGVPGAELPA